MVSSMNIYTSFIFNYLIIFLIKFNFLKKGIFFKTSIIFSSLPIYINIYIITISNMHQSKNSETNIVLKISDEFN